MRSDHQSFSRFARVLLYTILKMFANKLCWVFLIVFLASYCVNSFTAEGLKKKKMIKRRKETIKSKLDLDVEEGSYKN